MPSFPFGVYLVDALEKGLAFIVLGACGFPLVNLARILFGVVKVAKLDAERMNRFRFFLIARAIFLHTAIVITSIQALFAIAAGHEKKAEKK